MKAIRNPDRPGAWTWAAAILVLTGWGIGIWRFETLAAEQRTVTEKQLHQICLVEAAKLTAFQAAAAQRRIILVATPGVTENEIARFDELTFQSVPPPPPATLCTQPKE